MFVGQGRIVDTDGLRVRLDDTGETVATTWALPYRYHPQAYDAVTVMGSGERFYVTGLVRGRGRTEVDCAGDLPIACAGRMRLSHQHGASRSSDGFPTCIPGPGSADTGRPKSGS